MLPRTGFRTAGGTTRWKQRPRMPGHTPVSAEEEWARLEPVLEALREEIHIPISVDTYYPDVAKRAIRAGAAIINDVSGCVDNGMAAVAAQTGAGLVMMCPGDANVTETAADSFAAVRRYFRRALQIAAWAELPYERLCLDPGIGFGKSREDDLALIARLPELMSGLPAAAAMCRAMNGCPVRWRCIRSLSGTVRMFCGCTMWRRRCRLCG